MAGRYILRHTMAAIGSMFALLLIWFFINPLLNLLVTGELGSTWVEPPGNFFWCCFSIVWLIGIIFPLSIGAEYILVRKLKWQWQVHVPTLALVFFAVSVLPCAGLAAVSRQMPAQSELLGIAIFGLDNAIWGVAYWLLLRGSNVLWRPQEI